jgi:hypothetical protein
VEYDQPPPAIACSLGAGDLAERVERWQVLGRLAGAEVARTTRGLRVSFAAGPAAGAELAELAALERDCCAFATWSVSEHGERLVLEVSAITEDGVPAVQAMFAGLGQGAG